MQHNAAFSSQAVFEVLDVRYVRLYAHEVMSTLVTILQESAYVSVQEMVVSAVSSLAQALRAEFTDYYHGFAPALKMLLTQATDPGHSTLWQKGLECLTFCMAAVGQDVCEKDLDELLVMLLASKDFATFVRKPSALPNESLSSLLRAMERMVTANHEVFSPHVDSVMEGLLKCMTLPSARRRPRHQGQRMEGEEQNENGDDDSGNDVETTKENQLERIDLALEVCSALFKKV